MEHVQTGSMIRSMTKARDFDALQNFINTKTFKNLQGVLESLEVNDHTAAWVMLLAKSIAPRTTSGAPPSGSSGGITSMFSRDSRGGSSSGSVPPAGFAKLVEKLFMEMDVEQVWGVCAEALGKISHAYAAWCRQAKAPGRGIPFLLRAIKVLRPSPDHLTPLHCDYICLCLIQKKYALARDLLQTIIYDVSAKESGTQPRDFMLYYYYGGMVYIGLKDFDKAVMFFSTCICTPSTCPSAIVVEAYKKVLLVNLIARGKQFVIPRHCPVTVAKVIRMYAADYVEYCDLFVKSGNAVKEMAALLERSKREYQKDNNWGLIKQAQHAYTVQAIQKLTLTYDTLSLGDVAQCVGLASAAEAESLMVTMICNGQISARIDAEEQMAHFIDPPMSDNCALIAAELTALKGLSNRIQRMDDRIVCARAAADAVARQAPVKMTDTWDDEGRRTVMKSLMDTVFGAFKG